MIACVKEAEDKRAAIAHFNISDFAALRGIVSAVRLVSSRFHTNLPLFIGLSEGESDYVGIKTAKMLVDEVRASGINVFLNADHVHSLERLKAVVMAGYDSAVFDVSDRPIEENIKLTREAVSIARNINPKFVVEGEVGHIGGSSKLLEILPSDARISSELLTTPEEAKRYVEETGVDMLAPAVGNIHGMMKDFPNPAIDIRRIRDIAKAAGIPVVLHGGSGISDEEFIQAIYAGIGVIHINTELRVAWRRGLETSLAADRNEVAPYKLFVLSEKAVEAVAFERLKLFAKLV